MKEELYNTLKKAIIVIKKQHNDPDYRVEDHWWEENTTTSRYRNGRNGEDEIFEYIMDKDIFNYDYDFLGYLVAFIYWENDTDSVNIEVTINWNLYDDFSVIYDTAEWSVEEMLKDANDKLGEYIKNYEPQEFLDKNDWERFEIIRREMHKGE